MRHGQPLVSVIIPAYNDPRFLTEAVQSVLAQTFRDFELVVIDDGSPISLRPCFESCTKSSAIPTLYASQPNRGGAAARNHGIELSRGKWIAFLDHDDVWTANSLRSRLVAAETYERQSGRPAALVFGQFRYFADGRPVDGAVFPLSAPSGDYRLTLLERTIIRTLSVTLINREVVGAGSLYFREDLQIANDIELYHRLAAKDPFVFTEKVVAHKRSHDRNASSDGLRLHREIASMTRDFMTEGLWREARLQQAAARREFHHLRRAFNHADGPGMAPERREMARRMTTARPWSMAAWLCRWTT